MIPKQLFFYWSGRYMSWLRYMTLHTARFWNPDIEIKLYVSSDPKNKVKRWPERNAQDSFYYEGKNYFDKVEQLDIELEEWEAPEGYTGIEPAQKCDMFEWQHLYTHGGFYADMDIIFTKSIDSLYEDCCHADTLVCYQNYFSIGFMGSQKENDFFGDLYKNCFKTYQVDNYQTLGATNMYLMLSDSKHYGDANNNINFLIKIHQRYPNTQIYNMPFDLLYKYDYNHISEIFSGIYDYKNLLGLHWFGGSKFSKYWNNNLDGDTIHGHNSSFAQAIKDTL